jgi:hypothetical protein
MHALKKKSFSRVFFFEGRVLQLQQPNFLAEAVTNSWSVVVSDNAR